MEQDFRVCISCLKDPGLISWFKLQCKNSNRGNCKFCGRTNMPVMWSNDVIEYLRSFIFEGYSLCVESAPYIDREGGYQCPTYEPDELFDEYYDEIGSEKFEKYVRDYFCAEGQLYLWGDSYAQPNALQYAEWSWNHFSEVVKSNKSMKKHDSYNNEHASPEDFLELYLPLYYKISKCIKNEKAGTKIYRCRRENNKLTMPIDFQDLTSPPESCIKKDNRFSNKKVSLFYAALDEKTAEDETKCDRYKYSYVGKFSLINNLTILDLYKINPPNGRFDNKWKGLYLLHKFMENFTHEISIPPNRKPRNYKPTQKICEYIMNNKIGNRKIHGIKYKSSITQRPCYVLFFDNKSSRKYLKLESYHLNFYK